MKLASIFFKANASILEIYLKGSNNVKMIRLINAVFLQEFSTFAF
jgi:hypothetical protein